MSETILLKVKGLTDYQDDLDEIVAAALVALPDAEVEVEDPQRMQKGRYGVVLGEILNVFVSFAGGYAFGKVADAIVRKAAEGWKRHDAEQAFPRPRFVNFYGPHGEVLKEVRIDRETMADHRTLLLGDDDGDEASEGKDGG
jgi:hypothetical protein